MPDRYAIEWSASAARRFRELDRETQRRVARVVTALADDPRPLGATRLQASGGSWRVRVGDYRVVYDIADRELVVLVLAAQHRGDV